MLPRRSIWLVLLLTTIIGIGVYTRVNRATTLAAAIGGEQLSTVMHDAKKTVSADIFTGMVDKASLSKQPKRIGQTIILRFGSQPDAISVSDFLLNSGGSLRYAGKVAEMEVDVSEKNGEYSFTITRHIAALLSSHYVENSQELRGYLIRAKWRGFERVFSFVIRVISDLTAVEGIDLYYYSEDGDVVISRANNIDSPEAAACELAVLFMDNLKSSNKSRAFRITEYKDLEVNIAQTIGLDEEIAAIYSIQENEVSKDTWLVEISARYKYEGIMSPIGPSNNEWVDILYQGSPVGFLMTRNGNTYLLRSRYR